MARFKKGDVVVAPDKRVGGVVKGGSPTMVQLPVMRDHPDEMRAQLGWKVAALEEVEFDESELTEYEEPA